MTRSRLCNKFLKPKYQECQQAYNKDTSVLQWFEKQRKITLMTLM